MTDPQIADIRAFNRFYTRIIGLLEEGMHKSPYTLAEARLVYEIGKRGATTASAVAQDLGMDRGQMSRLMWRVMDHGLIALAPRADDRRSSPLALTPEGDAVFRQLEQASDRAAADLLDTLGAFERRDIVSAMRRIMATLAEPEPGALVLRPHRVGELGWLIHRQGLLYHLEQGWNGEFEALIARLYADFDAAPAAPPKALWIADKDGEVAGSVFVVPAAEGEGMAQLRMLYVEPAFRGLGIGRQLVDQAIQFARASGYRHIMLWTQDCLVAARKIYQHAGFELVREEKHRSFGTDLNGQFWQRDLAGIPPAQ